MFKLGCKCDIEGILKYAHLENGDSCIIGVLKVCHQMESVCAKIV